MKHSAGPALTFINRFMGSQDCPDPYFFSINGTVAGVSPRSRQNAFCIKQGITIQPEVVFLSKASTQPLNQSWLLQKAFLLNVGTPLTSATRDLIFFKNISVLQKNVSGGEAEMFLSDLEMCK